MKPELHLFIIWENARYKEKEIIEDIQKNMEIIEIYDFEWSKENFSNNLSRFYGTNLPKGSGKEVHCGNGKFLLIIVELKNPVYEERETSKGSKIVNVNMFDKKTLYREMTGGGHKVHATNDEKETNHDLTLLLNKNIEDFLKEHKDAKWDGTYKNISKDLFGCNSWDTVNDMFYALNNCANYAVLRNYENLPEEIYVNDHNDIDLICDSMEEVAYVLNAEPMHQESYRVQHKVNVEGRIAYFDLRFVGDNYYYPKLEEDILHNRIFDEKGFYVLEKQDYFYTLLYHALIQKPNFKDDYKEKLEKIGIENVNLKTSNEEYGKILKDWMIKKEYIAVKPNDITVYFNQENLEYLKPLVYREEQNCQKDNISELSIQNTNLIYENNTLKNENIELKNQLAGIKDSRTWKIFEPIRKIYKKIRKG